jgi:ribosomal protein L7Ae-like RNA K-turn-binding protein
MRVKVALPEGDWPLGIAREQVTRRQAELAGLALRAGDLKSGGNVVDRLMKKGWPTALVLSFDAGQTVADGLEKKARGRELALFRSLLGSEELGKALGRTGPRSVLALGSGSLARSLTVELKRGSALM